MFTAKHLLQTRAAILPRPAKGSIITVQIVKLISVERCSVGIHRVLMPNFDSAYSGYK